MNLLKWAVVCHLLAVGLQFHSKLPDALLWLDPAGKTVGLVFVVAAIALAAARSSLKWVTGLAFVLAALHFGAMTAGLLVAGKSISWGLIARFAAVGAYSCLVFGHSYAPTLLRLGLAATFFSHGLKSFQGHEEMVGILGAFYQFLGVEARPETVLRLIGISDMVLAVLVVLTPWRQVPIAMAAWTIMVACSKIFVDPWALPHNFLGYAPYYLSAFALHELTVPAAFRLPFERYLADCERIVRRI
jgi:hypothetical protein